MRGQERSENRIPGAAGISGWVVLGMVVLMGAVRMEAQEQQALPEAPVAYSSSNSAPDAAQDAAKAQAVGDGADPHQTKRILGVIPNFRAVSSDQKLPPQTAKQKFMTATEDSFDYSAVIVPALVAGYGMVRDKTPEFHQGAAGYGRYFWHSMVDQTSENYMVEFVVPVLTHEDTRYYTMEHGGFWKRTKYAMSRTVITRNDSGREVFNYSEVVGAGAASGISNLYYPAPERTFSNTAEQWGLDVGIDAITFTIKEFWPDINRKLFRAKNGD